jgi:hypothetical protein
MSAFIMLPILTVALLIAVIAAVIHSANILTCNYCGSKVDFDKGTPASYFFNPDPGVIWYSTCFCCGRIGKPAKTLREAKKNWIEEFGR